jgi:hypothetical protein
VIKQISRRVYDTLSVVSTSGHGYLICDFTLNPRP